MRRLFTISEDDEEEEEDGQAKPSKEAEETADSEMAESADGEVKREAGDEEQQKKKKKPANTPSHELHIYSAEELAGFKKREMIADAELLDGTCRLSSIKLYLTVSQKNSRMQSPISAS